jgi:UDP-N-acetylmuramyl pentapeptide phosphotransferase/UDP-N-acetylglucosamine-1-phosphate transferase
MLLVLNWEKYTGYTVGGNIRLGAGAIIALAIVALKLLGKLRMPRRVVLFAIVCGLSYLLAPLLNDLFLLSAAALVGEVADWAFFQTGIKRVREQINVEKSSDTTAEKMEEVLKKYMPGEEDHE